jgi:uncharacterized protein (DUF885 family)
MDASKRLDKLEKGFCKEWVRRHPLLGTSLGLHDEFDGLMPDGSLDKELDDHRLLHRTLSEFEKIEPGHLPPPKAVERDLALHVLKNWIFEREVVRPWETVPEAPRLVGSAVFQILSRNYAPLQHRMRAIMKRLERMPKYVDQSRSKLRAPTKMAVEIELETITRLPGFFNILKDIGREHLPVTPQRDLNRLIDHAQNALERYSDWLIVDVLPDCREEFVLGEEKFKKLLHVRGIDLSPGQISAAAEAEIPRLQERQRDLGREIRRKAALEDIRDMIKQQHPENFDGVLRYIRESVGKTRQFVTRSRFAALPEGEQLFVIETPGFLRHLLPFGGYWPPSKHEGRTDGYFFATPGDCDSDKLKEHNYGALSNLTVQQGYPGRHLQMAWASRHPSPLRALYEDPAVALGWPSYVEERAKEMGYDDTPSARFMQIQSSVLSAVRAMLDVRISTGRTGFQEAVENLIDQLGMDRVCAEAEVRRYISSPGTHAASYWGRDRLRELRRWARDRMESRFSETFFHTALLQSGPIPVPLLKREMEARIAEELRRPPEPPKEEAKKAASPAPKTHPKTPAAAAPRPRSRPAAARPRRPARRR